MKRRDGDYDEEIRQHLEIETRENLACGMAEREARLAAQRAFGNSGVVRQRLREGGAGYWLESLLQDVRYGARLLTRSLLLSFSIVITLTLGIGINTGVFTLLNAILLRPAGGERFFKVLGGFAYTGSGPGVRHDFSYTDYAAIRDRAKTVSDLAARRGASWTLGDGDPAPVRGMLVTCNYFAVYGLENAKMGRLFQPAECAVPGTGAAAVLSEQIWRDRFGANPDIVGTEIRLNRQAFTIVGVAPQGFADSRGSIWVPYTMHPRLESEDPFRNGNPWLQVEGRLSPGWSRTAVQAELRAIMRRQDELHPGRTNALLVTNGTEMEDPGKRGAALLGFYSIMAAMTLILLIACINVSTLLLSRAAARQHEIAVRLSLGAGAGRLMRMLLTESVILAGIAGACSWWLAYHVPGLIERLVGSPTRRDMSPDFRVFSYLFAMTLAAGLLAGFAPAAEALRVNLSGALKGPSGIFGGRRTRTRTILLTSQVALSAVLLAGAALLMRGQQTAFVAEPGYNTTHVFADFVNRPPNSPPADVFYRTLGERVRGLPGVQSVAWSENVRGASEVLVALPDRPTQPPRRAYSNTVTTGYFETLGIAILRGQAPANAAGSALVSEKFAHTFWPGEEPLGKLVQVGPGPLMSVAGVVRNTKAGLFGEPDTEQIYPLRATGSPGNAMIVRFVGSGAEVKLAMRKEIYAIDPRITSAPGTLQSLIARDAEPFGKLLQMVLFLGAVATLMVVVGIYGVAAFSVRQRSRELGIRVALGASKAEIVRLVMVTGTRPVGVGLGLGMGLAVAAAVPLAMAFKGTPVRLPTGDWVAYGAAALVLVIAAGAAMFGPALRAAGADPVRTLRQE